MKSSIVLSSLSIVVIHVLAAMDKKQKWEQQSAVKNTSSSFRGCRCDSLAPTLQLTIICYASVSRSDAFFWSPKALHAHGAWTYM